MAAPAAADRAANSSLCLAPYLWAARAKNRPWQLEFAGPIPYLRILGGANPVLACRKRLSEGSFPFIGALQNTESGTGDQKPATISNHTIRSVGSDRQDLGTEILQFLASGRQEWAWMQAADRQEAGEGLVQIDRGLCTD